MQNKNYKKPENDNKNFSLILQKARAGDSKAMEKLIYIFEDEIDSLSKYMKVSREDVVQELYAELMFLVRGED